MMQRSVQRVAAFIRAESAGGVVMLLAAALALGLANSIFSAEYQSFIHLPLSLTLGDMAVTHSLAHWVSEVGMILFFFVVGMELKRELCEGVLTDRRQVLLPLVAALGGMAVPALVYMALNGGIPEHLVGWAIPTATDIAFALAVLLLAGRHAPPAMKIFLLAIAIFDDLGAILVIALFYSHGLALLPLAVALLLTGGLWLLNRLGVARLLPYLLLGAGLCFALAEGGIHATIGGVVAGMAIPLRNRAGYSPLGRCLHGLHPWVSFGLLPLFALTAAGITLDSQALAALGSPLPLGVVLGLFLGKPLGIGLASVLMVWLRVVRLPDGMGWMHLAVVGVLAGIGFTMSLFITNLAFADALLVQQAKMGVVVGSVLSALVGMGLMQLVRRG